MNDPTRTRRAEAVPDIASSAGFGSTGSDQWLGGEAMVGPGYSRSKREAGLREWSHGEALVLMLAGLTLGTALGMLLGRPRS
ncbi:hypothetical protein DNFV4_03658 [Nitrospira tepida]|uniref:Uncharacterized protein n=1 Tax=Nitrospira tepida TaxID=2973512 RepID=A0AA86N216_9BACT|nr:hypothetical protein [Nitrospira tepida]CAI4033224.1 hypothetical protein DNFV4_03658 [Nitrospira tepida]